MKPPQMATAAFQDFLTTPLQTRLARHLSTSPQDRVVELFRGAARDIPAYREFLTSQGIDSADVKTYADFQTLPLTTKQNYMLAYPLPALTRDGRLAECEMVAVSSGSTGKPLFWPRSSMHELDIATRFEHVFHGSFHADTRPTLVVICFALGSWVGGMYTALCCRYLAQKGYPSRRDAREP
jgi:phenylacetate-CoA ligase